MRNLNADALLALLHKHQTRFDEELFYVKMALDFVQKHPEDYWKRSLLQGHITGSAWVLGPQKDKAILIHHAALNKWVQPGGHVDDTDASVKAAALREAQEECGLSELEPMSSDIFDLDIHFIPEKKGIPAHFHYDVRFLFWAQNEAIHFDKNEVNDAKWLSLDTLINMDLQQAVRRMVIKSRQIQGN